ncbi:2-oxoglutarate dehydrogenase E1 component [Alkalihalobacillus sp. BA299]|uniref:2-oxoglutarate dehydrogenase E1 component n=1 Tax=Alkalihalobacillus sp. BA299 TaxID=2815938 RepID=UPI001ADA3C4B|nr:2-oxoglutarate dehydrogenase E1 component [Alkalihalobacillus sp. BA299]
MTRDQSKQEKLWQQFHGPNLGYIIEQYEKNSLGQTEVDEDIIKWLQTINLENNKEDKTEDSLPSLNFEKVASAMKLADAIRQNGHIIADIYPFSIVKKEPDKFHLKRFQLTEADLLKIPYPLICPYAPTDVTNGKEAIDYLKEVYTKTLAFEFSHVHEEYECEWLTEMVESGAIYRPFSSEGRKALLERLIEVEAFEQFLHRTFVGQKRFSIEGLDTLIPMLDCVVEEAVQEGVSNIMIGMAHRGRLNVLAHVLGKPYELIFAEFLHAPNKKLVPSEGSIGINYGWTGDVKYHLGANRKLSDRKTEHAKLTLANNPSHLEFVNPVVEGFTRASQEDRTNKGNPSQDSSQAFAILIHGDAAFPGQGIVAETLNLSRLIGYQTGGTIHIIANNLIGFTTDMRDSRSTRYASDLAKGFEIPIVHVKADDPEACLAAIHLAFQYRSRFKKDILIDLVGYRRFGHNEMDEPMMTQPKMYSAISQHPTVRTKYGDYLLENDWITHDVIKAIEYSIQENLESAYEKMKQIKQSKREVAGLKSTRDGLPNIETKVEANSLKKINEALLTWPNQININEKLEKILKRRIQAFDGQGKIDWGFAETLAFATILSDGTPVRITGQDSERGTFAQRHLVLHDRDTGEAYSPLHIFPQAKASFAIHNSPLSEAAVVGFEYGYNVFAPETLVLWEAQYGDFANSAQVLFDQFISAGQAKWGQKSGLVLLLPHGYEGQGPEHSSARLERFLQLSAEQNWTVANVSTAAQYFHLLRRQAATLKVEEVKPLVVMTPKSMLRHPRTASTITDLSEGSFQPFLQTTSSHRSKEDIKRIVFSSGKIGVELIENIEKLPENKRKHIHHIQIEELYPFPENRLKVLVSELPSIEEILWVQEEPKNMGVWTYIEPRLRALLQNVPVKYIGRISRSSPAEGDPNVHKKEQERIIYEAIQF